MRKSDIMLTNVVELLERAAAMSPDKTAYVGAAESVTYRQLLEQTWAVGTYTAQNLAPLSAVAIFMARDIQEVAAIYGVITGGCIATPLEPKMPADRAMKIFETLHPACIITDGTAQALLEALGPDLPCPVVDISCALAAQPDQELLDRTRLASSILDPVQIYYTSGSTGMPKGVVYTHRSVLSYVATATSWDEVVNDRQVFGNQAPLYYANAITETYTALACRSTVYFMAHELFMFPDALLRFLQEKRVTSCTMTPFNYVYIADAGVLSPGCLPDLQTLYFSGELIAYNKMRMWADAAPNAQCVNFYGSTESPYMAQYALDGDDKVFAPGDPIPAGELLPGVRLLILDENGDRVGPGQPGQICVTSPQLSAGYYNDPIRSQAAFRRDPLGLGWNETYYFTGDYGRFDEDGMLIILGRQDSQIKYRGYRMDLGEVDAALRSLPGWENGCCLMNEAEDRLYCFWCGALTQSELQKGLAARLERYMIPNAFVHLDELPHTDSFKLDRVALRRAYFQAK